MPFLEVKNVSKSYGSGEKRTEVLHNINLTIEEGEFVAIIGYSGAGKTTLISLLAGLIKPDTGTVKFQGQEMDGPGPDRGLVFQNYSLLPWLTVYENIALAVDQVFPDWPAAQRKQHIEKHIATVNLTHARDRRPSELSGGMRQRVSLARTLSIQPKILLLDEPLSALDALTRATLQDEISRIWQEDRKTVILITNDPDEAILLADRVIPLTAGPQATLGPDIPIDLPRPRERETVTHSQTFKTARLAIVDDLLASAARKRTILHKTLILPDIEPEDLTIPRPLGAPRKRPIRRSEIHKEDTAA